MTTTATRQTLRIALDAYRLRAETAEARAVELEKENALLKRALAMLTHSLADTTERRPGG